MYDGTGRDGTLHGYGAYRWPDGGRYKGEWRNDSRSGRGMLTESEGSTCEGEWLNGVLQGTGTGTENGVEKPCYPLERGFTFQSGSTPEPTAETPRARQPPSDRSSETSPAAPVEDDSEAATAQGPSAFQLVREVAVLFPILAFGYYLITRLAVLLVGAVSGSVRTGGKWPALGWIHGLGAAVALALAVLTVPLVGGMNAAGSIFLLLGPVLLVRAIDARRYRHPRGVEPGGASLSRSTAFRARPGIP